jgi:hypothetical protein
MATLTKITVSYLKKMIITLVSRYIYNCFEENWVKITENNYCYIDPRLSFVS